MNAKTLRQQPERDAIARAVLDAGYDLAHRKAANSAGIIKRFAEAHEVTTRSVQGWIAEYLKRGRATESAEAVPYFEPTTAIDGIRGEYEPPGASLRIGPACTSPGNDGGRHSRVDDRARGNWSWKPWRPNRGTWLPGRWSLYRSPVWAPWPYNKPLVVALPRGSYVRAWWAVAAVHTSDRLPDEKRLPPEAKEDRKRPERWERPLWQPTAGSARRRPKFYRSNGAPLAYGDSRAYLDNRRGWGWLGF